MELYALVKACYEPGWHKTMAPAFNFRDSTALESIQKSQMPALSRLSLGLRGKMLLLEERGWGMEGGKDREKCCNDIIISKIKKLKIPECNWFRYIEFYFISNPSFIHFSYLVGLLLILLFNPFQVVGQTTNVGLVLTVPAMRENIS